MFHFNELNLSGDQTTWLVPPSEAVRKMKLGRQILVNSSRDLAKLSGGAIEQILTESNLSSSQRTQLAAVVASSSPQSADPGYWLSFYQDNLQEKSREKAIERTLRQWTNFDFNAAATWIGEQERGAVRDLSVQTFATAVAPHEPDAAAEWAITLPPSPERKNLLQIIYNSWESEDSTAASEFAQSYGLVEKLSVSNE